MTETTLDQEPERIET